MLPLEIDTAVLCDDIRQERNGKYLLIGVYGANIVVRTFPADLVLALWMLARVRKSGRSKMRIRVVGPQEAILVEGGLEFDHKDTSKAAILALPGMPMQLQKEGQLRFEMSPGDGEEWILVKKIGVELLPGKVQS